MLTELDRLSASEQELMMKAPLLVCILIAGADEQIDAQEVKGAIQLAESARKKEQVSTLFRMAAEDFEDKFKIILQGLPQEPAERNQTITEELKGLNATLPRLNPTFAKEYLRCLRFVAKRIAQSSGGVLGINSIGEEESALINLPMIIEPASKG